MASILLKIISNIFSMIRFNKILLIILLIALLPILAVCSKNKKTYSLIDTEWEVVSITSPNIHSFLKSPTSYHVNFQKNNIFNISLDVNSCGSTYRIDGDNNISIDPLACTKVCCDKQFADTLINILKDVKSYKIAGENLELFSADKIINLSKVNKDNFETREGKIRIFLCSRGCYQYLISLPSTSGDSLFYPVNLSNDYKQLNMDGVKIKLTFDILSDLTQIFSPAPNDIPVTSFLVKNIKITKIENSN
jgi:heat shock protein HslJ